MRLAHKIVVVTAAIAVTAGITGGSVLAANASEKPTAQAVVSEAPSRDVQNDLALGEGRPVDANSASGDVQIMAIPRACRNNTTPSVVGMSIRAYCFWLKLGLPKTRMHKEVAGAISVWTGGGQFGNFERKLPSGGNHMYMEYDMTPHTKGNGRNANRIVIDIISGLKYYTTDHYRTFHQFSVPSDEL